MKERLAQLLAPYREQITAQLDTLQPRERAMVAIAAVAVVLAILYGGIWKPVHNARHHAEQRLVDARDLATQLERASTEVPHTGPAAAGGGGSLLSVVDESAKTGALGKPLSRLSPDSDNQVRAWVDDVPFEALVHWMYDLQTRYGVRVDTADVEGQDTPGVVNARLTLVRAK
jgi:general secretion pathway protein M